ncbi:MAG: DUF6194 family protein [Chthonomonadales bacterium]
MNETTVTQFIVDSFPDVETSENFGYTFFFYKTDHILPFATLSSSDNEYDQISNLNRPGVFRLNIGISKQSFHTIFGHAVIDTTKYDFTVLDTILPHPEYARQYFVCILNPSDNSFLTIVQLLTEAYSIAETRNSKRNATK